MKEISEELEKRDVAICICCGALFEDVESIAEPCLECKRDGLFFITPNHSWLGCGENYERKEKGGNK